MVLVGRANAGKSTLFNRIARGRRAIVSPVAGTTRDLNVGQAEHRGRNFFVVDSGGLELGGRERLGERVAEGALRAVALADVVVFMLDGRAGLGPGDREAIALIRETGRPMVAAINKMDRAGMEAVAGEYHALGVSPMVLVSAAHGRGVEELLEEIVERLPAAEAEPSAPPDLRLALIGRPERRQIIAAQSPRRLRARDRRRHSWHHARPGRRAASRRRPRRAPDRYCRNSPAHQGRGRARAFLGRPRDRDHPPRRGAGAGDRFDRGRHRPGRAPGAAGRERGPRAGPGLQQVGPRGERGAPRCGVRARRASECAVSGLCRDAVYVGAHRRRRRQDHPGCDEGGRFVARDFPDRASQSHSGRGHCRDGPADGRSGGGSS